MISASIIKDSVTPDGNRLTTFVLAYPRFIHAEFMTHRCFSRNAASSRAIPVEKMVHAVRHEPALPEFWGANQKGMQAAEQLEPADRHVVQRLWQMAGLEMAGLTSDLSQNYNLHKQIANRLIEPWSHITVIATSGERGLRNFFGLRAHKDAQPEFQILAYRMLDAYLASIPDRLNWNDWHTPFDSDIGGNFDELRLKICTGRIARVSYLTHDGIRDPDKDIELHDKLMESGHWSPFEHCAKAEITHANSNLGPNWTQYRKQFLQECQTPDDVQLKNALDNRPSWFTL